MAVPNLIEELSQVRMAISALRAKENVLSKRLVRQGGLGEHDGQTMQCRIREVERKELNTDALPPEILNDDRFWRVETGHKVRIRPIEGDIAALPPARVVVKGDIVAVARR